MINTEIVSYIQSELQKGVDKQSITNSLIANGWNTQDVNEAFAAMPSMPVSTAPSPSSENTKMSPWAKRISRLNNVFLVIYLILIFGLDFFVASSSWRDLATFWYLMLGVFAVWLVFYFLENFLFKKKFKDSNAGVDKAIFFLIVLRNLVALLNFIPFIQLLGLALLSGFFFIVSIFGSGRGFGMFGAGPFGLVAMIGPALLILYIVLVIKRFSQTKKS